MKRDDCEVRQMWHAEKLLKGNKHGERVVGAWASPWHNIARICLNSESVDILPLSRPRNPFRVFALFPSNVPERAVHKSRNGPPGAQVYSISFSTSHWARRFEEVLSPVASRPSFHGRNFSWTLRRSQSRSFVTLSLASLRHSSSGYSQDSLTNAWNENVAKYQIVQRKDVTRNSSSIQMPRILYL